MMNVALSTVAPLLRLETECMSCRCSSMEASYGQGLFELFVVVTTMYFFFLVSYLWQFGIQ